MILSKMIREQKQKRAEQKQRSSSSSDEVHHQESSAISADNHTEEETIDNSQIGVSVLSVASEPSPELSSTAVSLPPFYLNLLLLNKSEVVGNKVHEKTGISGFFGRVAVYSANKMIPDEKIITNLAENLITGVGKAIDEMGITADFDLKFVKGALAVIRIQITDINTLQIILSAKGPEFASNFMKLLAATSKLGMEKTVLSNVNNKLQSTIIEGMIGKFNEMIPHKLAEKGVIIDCHACKKEDQAEIFFELYDRIMMSSSETSK
jgi:hypothetical protein